jgi:hypothetical protein
MAKLPKDEWKKVEVESEPVPPPSPAHKRTTSTPLHSARKSVRLSLAEARPRATSPPDPRPLATP